MESNRRKKKKIIDPWLGFVSMVAAGANPEAHAPLIQSLKGKADDLPDAILKLTLAAATTATDKQKETIELECKRSWLWSDKNPERFLFDFSSSVCSIVGDECLVPHTAEEANVTQKVEQTQAKEPEVDVSLVQDVNQHLKAQAVQNEAISKQNIELRAEIASLREFVQEAKKADAERQLQMSVDTLGEVADFTREERVTLVQSFKQSPAVESLVMRLITQNRELVKQLTTEKGQTVPAQALEQSVDPIEQSIAQHMTKHNVSRAEAVYAVLSNTRL